MGLSIKQICFTAYHCLVDKNGVEELSDDQLDQLAFAVQNERIERAIERGEYKPEEE